MEEFAAGEEGRGGGGEWGDGGVVVGGVEGVEEGGHFAALVDCLGG